MALTLGCWSFVQSERYRRATDLTLSQSYEILWRSAQIREQMERTAGYLRLASKTGEIDPALDRDMILVGVNVQQILALEYVGRFLKQKEVDQLLTVRDMMENQIAPIVATGKGFDQALRYMNEVEQHMFDVSGAANAHSLAMNETDRIAIAATHNSFVFALALTFVAVGHMMVLQRSDFAKRRDQQIRSFSSLFAHMTRSRITALRLFLDLMKDETAPSAEMLQAAQEAIKELDGINDGLLRIAYSERDPRAEPLGELLERVVIARGGQIRVKMDNAARALPVPATPVQLIVDELVSNAATAVRGKDDAEITIRATLLKRRFPFACRLVIDVTDNGVGMQPDVVEEATVPFFSTRAGTHVGLGLTGCAQMVNTMRGKLSITSTPGIGTLVRILLPISTTSGSVQGL
ncbi:sensor histidine kinase [Mesorhizobium sp. BHbsci]